MNIQANIPAIEHVSAVLVEMLGDDFDAETFWDTLDGETDVMDIIGHLLKERVEAKAFAAASKDQAAIYAARAKRLTDKDRAITTALGALLDAAGQAKVNHPLGTVSRTKPRVSVDVYDAAEIPTQLTVTTTRPDAAAIKKQLEAGEAVPGAQLVAGEPGLTVRTK